MIDYFQADKHLISAQQQSPETYLVYNYTASAQSLSRAGVLLIFLATLIACSSGSGDGLDESGTPLDSDAGDSSDENGLDNDSKVSANYQDIQDKVFDISCATSGCHSGAAAPLGLRLDSVSSFDHTVNQPSVQQDQILRIKPGDPDNSYLIQKLEGTAASGTQMPRNQPALPVETIQAIRDWIEAGALGPRFTSLQSNFFTPVCTQCHVGSSPAGGLNLEEAQSHMNLVGIPRSNGPENRVTAGNAADSFLMDKLEGNNLGGDRGDRMPLGGPFLSADEISVFKRWIDEGAVDN